MHVSMLVIAKWMVPLLDYGIGLRFYPQMDTDEE